VQSQSHAPENSVQKQLFIHFGLRENPFGGTPDPRFLFHSETHREALASLVNGIGCEFGFQVLVAQPGMGKTTLLFNFLERFRDTAHTAFLFQPQLEPHELLQSLLLELGVVSEDTSVRKLSEQINQVLGHAAQEHKRVIVVVDEAQNLDFAVLEALRQLSNFETAQAKLMQIVLAGQPELVRKLAAPEQEQLRQRISTISRLSPLTFVETRAYINHRLRTAGYRGSELFNLEASRHIWESSKGVPRKINTLCFNAMLLGFAGNTKSIDETILDEAARDLDMPSVLADIYRMEPSLAVSQSSGGANGYGKAQPIRETRLPETGSPKLPNLAAAQRSLLQKMELNPATAPSGHGNNGSAGENIPLALVEAIVRISQTLEEQKVLLAAKSVSSAEPLPATASILTPAATTLAPAAPVTKGGTSIQSAGSVSAKKESSPKGEKTISPQQKSANSASSAQLEVAAKPSLLAKPPAESRNVSTHRSGAKKPSKGVGFWPKALALAAITSVLTFVVVERTLSQHPAQADAEASAPASEQNNSSSGYSVPRGSPASPMDSPLRPSKDTATSLRARGNSGSDEFDDVTIRKFNAEPGTGPGAQSGTRGLNSIFFDQDSAAIDERYQLALQGIADALAKDPQASAILEGHTDDSGPEAYNLDLSSRRAIAVREALINEFNVPSTQLTAIGSGSAAPVRPNSSAAGRAYNRRVAVRLVRLGE
jgi:type II secretory pathway predicted ATPase ExeA/outer membrane protein OmpA-like peptidoglycan-associated protein